MSDFTVCRCRSVAAFRPGEAEWVADFHLEWVEADERGDVLVCPDTGIRWLEVPVTGALEKQDPE